MSVYRNHSHFALHLQSTLRILLLFAVNAGQLIHAVRSTVSASSM